jgi:hypothetical protein
MFAGEMPLSAPVRGRKAGTAGWHERSFPMSAQLRPADAPPQAACSPDSDKDPAADAVLDRWLRQELGRLYDAALSEPLPDALTELLDAPQGQRKPRG